MTAAALVACSSAGAEPGAPASFPPGPPPAGWKQLPAIATAVAAAARADEVVIDAADAFGEPAIGCYAVRLALHGSAAAAAVQADQVADQVIAGFLAGGGPRAAAAGTPARPAGSQGASAENPGGIAISEVVKPSGADGVLAFAFARPPYHGRVRAQLGHGRIAAIACFANQREPLACAAACMLVLQDVPPGAPEGTR
jgi:hypothetical protein